MIRKIIYSLIFALGLFGVNAFGQVDLTVKQLQFSDVTVSPGVKGYALSIIIQKKRSGKYRRTNGHDSLARCGE